MKNNFTEKNITLGSLFDGIGGFPLAATCLGITPLWASEIETAPISITKRHFPDMQHLGDITKINGAGIDPVNIITFGSPCQDLSLAGNRAGLNGERSGLFMEAIRIIKEMRNATHGKYPTFAVWENVTGAFSSNGGRDFRVVLQEISSITENGVSIPKPSAEADGGLIWKSAGAIMGNSFSLAWRVFDAQYWGVPQRRKRIFLVADFRGQRAAEILFKPDSLQGNSSESGKAREKTAGDIASGFGETSIGYWQNRTQCLRAEGENRPSRPSNVVVEKTVWPYVAGSLLARSDSSPCIDRGQPFVCYDARGNGDGKIVNTLTGDHQNRITDYTALAIHQNQYGELQTGKKANTLNINGNASGRNAPLVAHGNHSTNEELSATLRVESNNDQSLNYINPVCVAHGQANAEILENISPTLNCNHEQPFIADNGYIVRRLTPVECERLQGFPDGWTEYGVDGKKISDSARYKALGNSIAIPCVDFIMSRIAGGFYE